MFYKRRRHKNKSKIKVGSKKTTSLTNEEFLILINKIKLNQNYDSVLSTVIKTNY